MLVSFVPFGEAEKKKASKKMVELVCDISKYARHLKPGFIIIPQNGPELAFTQLNPDAGFNAAYIDAIDGVATEDLFYDGKLKTDNYRLKLLQEIRQQRPVLFSDFAPENQIDAIAEKAKKEDFLFFGRNHANEHYTQIPKTISHENARDITKLNEAKNHLYLINSSGFKSKSEYLKGISETNYDLVVIDLFSDEKVLTQKEVEKLKVKANGGKRLVVSYVNIGAVENWRYYWENSWKLNDPSWIKKRYEGFDGEYYVEYWHPKWQKIIFGNDQSYMKKIIDAGFDGAFLDNVEAYYFLYRK